MYKGCFEEIKELDEEHLYNSWVNSCDNTERMLTDPMGSSQKMTPVIKVIEEEEDNQISNEILFDDKNNPNQENYLSVSHKNENLKTEIPNYYYQDFVKTKKDKKEKENPPKIPKSDKKTKKNFEETQLLKINNNEVNEIYMNDNIRGKFLHKHNSADMKSKKNAQNIEHNGKNPSKHGFDLFENQLKSLHFKTKSEENRQQKLLQSQNKYNKSFKIRETNSKKMFHSTRNPIKYLINNENNTNGNSVKVIETSDKKKIENPEKDKIKNKLKTKIKNLFKKKKISEKIFCKNSDNFHSRNRSFNSLIKKEDISHKTIDNNSVKNSIGYKTIDNNSVKNSIGYNNLPRKPINSKHFRNPLKK